jgi:hypothetical protein
MKTKVLITVNGGVAYVTTNDPEIEVVIVDFDNARASDDDEDFVDTFVTVVNKITAAEVTGYANPTNPIDIKTVKELTELGFFDDTDPILNDVSKEDRIKRTLSGIKGQLEDFFFIIEDHVRGLSNKELMGLYELDEDIDGFSGQDRENYTIPVSSDLWIVTDPNCNQMMKVLIPNLKYLFKEDRISNPGTGEIFVHETEINLSEYTDDAIIKACEPFGYKKEQVLEWLKTKTNIALIAECIFEMET